MDFLVRAETIRQDFTEEEIGLKKINGKWYAIGNYVNDACNLKHFIYLSSTKGLYSLEIDYGTRAIHFEDMIDSEGTKIFASLSEDGRGGDVLQSLSKKPARLIYSQNTMQWDIYSVTYSKDSQFGICSIGHMKNAKVTGIQE